MTMPTRMQLAVWVFETTVVAEVERVSESGNAGRGTG